ncbi:hypothetical protein TNCV_1578511 [Trichonephila clavipes]|nr:hypothetical protein TNCV_1578511 [Trichonephila clavipes]
MPKSDECGGTESTSVRGLAKGLLNQLESMCCCGVKQKILVVTLPELRPFTSNGFPQATFSRTTKLSGAAIRKYDQQKIALTIASSDISVTLLNGGQMLIQHSSCH